MQQENAQAHRLAAIADQLFITNQAEAHTFKDLIVRAVFAYAATLSLPGAQRRELEQLELLYMMFEDIAAVV